MSDIVVRSLADCEAVIERGMHTFVEVGQALAEINTAKLYKDTHGTFEDYCQERWGMSRRYAYDTMGSARVVGELSAIAHTALPSSEAVARELTPLAEEPQKLQEVWSEAVEKFGDRPTAKQVREVRNAGEDKAPDDREMCPACGRPLPANLRLPKRRNGK